MRNVAEWSLGAGGQAGVLWYSRVSQCALYYCLTRPIISPQIKASQILQYCRHCERILHPVALTPFKDWTPVGGFFEINKCSQHKKCRHNVHVIVH